MLTVTSGRYVRRKMTVPRGDVVRPTPSMVRSAVFDIARHLRGEPFNHFLDCFAGSGIMGIEALSRGAADVVFVEYFRSACHAIENNLQSLGEPHATHLIRRDVRKAVTSLSEQGRTFDGIYMDPPYREVEMRDELLERLGPLHLLSGDGLLMVEYQTRYPAPPETLAGFSLLTSRKWGETMVNFYGTQDGGLSGVL